MNSIRVFEDNLDNKYSFQENLGATAVASGRCGIGKLPRSLLTEALTYCSRQDWTQLRATSPLMNRFIRQLVDDADLWKKRIRHDFSLGHNVLLKIQDKTKSLPSEFYCELYASLQKGECVFRSFTLCNLRCRINHITFAPRDNRLVAGLEDGTVRVWEAEGTSWRLAAPLTSHTDWVTSVTFDPRTRRIISGSRDRTVRVWEPEGASWRLASTLTGHTNWVTSVAFDPRTGRIISGSYDGTVRVWEPEGDSWRLVETLTSHTSGVMSVVFDPRTGRIISGSYDGFISGSYCGTVRVWESEGASWRLAATLTGHTARVMSVVFDPRTGRIISGSYDGILRVWEPEGTSWRLIETLTDHTDWVMSVVFDPRTGRIISGSYDGTVRVWEPKGASWRLATTLNGHTGWVSSVAFDPRTGRIISGSGNGTVRVWELNSLALINRVTTRLKFRRNCPPIRTRLTALTAGPVHHLSSYLPDHDQGALSLVSRRITRELSPRNGVVLKQVRQRRRMLDAMNAPVQYQRVRSHSAKMAKVAKVALVILMAIVCVRYLSNITLNK